MVEISLQSACAPFDNIAILIEESSDDDLTTDNEKSFSETSPHPEWNVQADPRISHLYKVTKIPILLNWLRSYEWKDIGNSTKTLRSTYLDLGFLR